MPILIALTLALPVAAGAQGMPPPDPEAETEPWSEGFRPLPFHRIAEAASARYQGRLVAAETRPPRPVERELGAQLVYEFRLLTPAQNLLVIRMDARDGRFLDVAGRGQIEARRRR
ncbi:MAG: PepSY domain-containing protein [Paracoccus sp. (in: a-proteobacteria)]